MVTKYDPVEYLINKFGSRYEFSHHHCSLGHKEDFMQVVCKHHGDFVTKFRNLKGRKFVCHACYSLETNLTKIERRFPNYYFEVTEVREPPQESKVSFFCHVHGYVSFNIRRVLKDGDTPCRLCERLKVVGIIDNLSNKFQNLVFSHSEFVSTANPIPFICKQHGKQFRYNFHMLKSKNGCVECDLDEFGHTTGFKRSDFIKICSKSNKGKGILYLIRCYKDYEYFYKIGITSKSVKCRYKSRSNMPYEYELVYQREMIAGDCYDLENTIKRMIRYIRYEPTIGFGGSITECFLPNDEQLLDVIKYFK